MAVIPIKESGNTFSHLEANQPFAIESAIVNAGNLDVTVGDGRISWGGQTYELDTAGSGTLVQELSIPAAVDDYYVVIDIGGFAGGFPQLDIITTPPATNTDADLVYLGYVTTTATPTVDTITDLRTMQPSSGGWRGFDGSAAAPTYSFAGDPDTGIFLTATGQIGFSTAGTQQAILSGTTLQVEVPLTSLSGTAGAPTYSFSGDPDTGLYRPTADQVGVSVAGTLVSKAAAAGWLPGTDGVQTLGNSANRWEQVFLKGGTGSADIVADFDQGYTLYSDNVGGGTDNTRLWLNTPNQGQVVIGPRGGSSFLDTFEVRSDQIIAENGTAALPSYSFDSDRDSGFYWTTDINTTGLDAVAIAVGGTQCFGVANNGGSDIRWYANENNDYIRYDAIAEVWSFYTQDAQRMSINNSGELQANIIRVNNNGSAAAPPIRFNDPDTGWWHNASLNRVMSTVDGSDCTITVATQFVPAVTNARDLGNATFRWDQIFYNGGSLGSSDRNLKTEIVDSDIGLDFLRAMGVKKWRWKKGRRPHVGPTAQDVKRAMDELGIEDFGAFIDPSVKPLDPEQWPEAYDEHGNLTEDSAMLAVNDRDLAGMTMQAVIDVADLVDDLTRRIETLEARPTHNPN